MTLTKRHWWFAVPYAIGGAMLVGWPTNWNPIMITVGVVLGGLAGPASIALAEVFRSFLTKQARR